MCLQGCHLCKTLSERALCVQSCARQYCFRLLYLSVQVIYCSVNLYVFVCFIIFLTSEVVYIALFFLIFGRKLEVVIHFYYIKFGLLVLIRRRIFMEKTQETGLKRLMFNYIKLLFCAVVSVALLWV